MWPTFPALLYVPCFHTTTGYCWFPIGFLMLGSRGSLELPSSHATIYPSLEIVLSLYCHKFFWSPEKVTTLFPCSVRLAVPVLMPGCPPSCQISYTPQSRQASIMSDSWSPYVVVGIELELAMFKARALTPM